MLTAGVSPIARSVRRRRARRAALRWYLTPALSPYVWGVVPVLSPYDERLWEAAMGGHRCQIWRVEP